MKTYFLITLNEDGTLTSYSKLPEDLPEVKPATNYDIYQAAKQIVEEFELTILANRVASTVMNALMPQVATPADAIKDKLKERGINPESPATEPIN